MNATPLADLANTSAPTAQGTPGDKGAIADLLLASLDPGADPRGASTFAALLQDASLVAGVDASDERLTGIATDAETEPVAAPSALDTLLFLANVPGASSAAPDQAVQAPEADIDDTDIPVLTSVVVPPIGEGTTANQPAPVATPTSRLASAAVALRDTGMPATAASVQNDEALEAVFESSDVVPAVSNTAAPHAEAAAPAPAAPTGVDAPSFAIHAQHAAAPGSDAIVELHTPVQHPAWRHEAAQQMASLVTRGVERAELRLSPAELGPVEVRIDMRGNEATLAIVATQPATREALEQALPALRDLLSQQGLSLGEATVRDGRADGQPANERSAHAATSGAGDNGVQQHDRTVASVRRSVRLVDTFA